MSWVRKRRDKTDHGYVTDRLSAYLDGELSPQEQRAVSQHLAACQACRWQFDSLQQTVQWTRELPTIPVPRVFTIQARAQPVPVPRQRRGWLPLLQGATALIALLLVLTVAGDIMLTGVLPTGTAPAGSMPALAPQPEAVMEQAVADIVPTQEAEQVEKSIVLESEAMVKEEAAEPGQAPEAEAALPAQGAETEAEAPMMMQADVAPTLPPEAGGMTLSGEGSTDAQEKSAERASAPPALGVEEAAEEAESAAGTAEPTATSAPTDTPTVQPPTAAPTAIALAPAEQPRAEDDPGRQAVVPLRQPYLTWLRGAECALGALLVALLTTTVVVVVQRRRTR